MISEENKIEEKDQRSIDIDRMRALEKRLSALESKLDEKDRELREVSINRAEFIQQLDSIYKMLKNTRKQSLVSSIINSALDRKMEPGPGTETVAKDDTEGLEKKNADTRTDSAKLESNSSVQDELETMASEENKLDIIESMEPNRLEFLGKYSYRERMILMNRIDIYRLYITVIILSSQIKYPRAITNIEEKEIKDFIDELSEFENIVLDLNAEEDIIWEKGKVCEKRATQLFTRFFNI